MYDYSEIDYIDTQVKVRIKCKTHGSFYQSPEAHLGGQGCPECGKFKNTRLLTTSEFIENARKIHGDRYSYDLVKYEGATQHVLIECRTHGVFKQRPCNHLNSRGCPKCSVHGFKLKEQGCLYILASESITKIGVTNNSVSDRCKYISRKSKIKFSVVDNFYINGFRCLQIEQKLLKYMRDKYQQPSKYFHGYSECFYDVDLEDIRDKIIKEINEKEIEK